MRIGGREGMRKEKGEVGPGDEGPAAARKPPPGPQPKPGAGLRPAECRT